MGGKLKGFNRKLAPLAATAALAGYAGSALACACGCGVFNVGLPGLPVTGVDTEVGLQYSFMDQNMNRSGTSGQAATLNPDKQIRTDYYTLYGQHMFTADWGVQVMLPYWRRSFTTDTSGAPGQVNPAPSIQSAQVSTWSDMRIMGMYTGFSPDKSVGITFGLKLPTGPTQASPLLDRDTEPGTGTTDSLLGFYRQSNISTNWGSFSQGVWRHALHNYQGYKPGDSINVVYGLTYRGIASATRITPMVQLNAMWRGHDQGGGDAQYGNANSGYPNLYLVPGALLQMTRSWRANAALYLPLYRKVNGSQLVPHYMLNAGVTYMF